VGLAISVGVLADLLENDPEGAEWLEEGLASANQVLEAAGLPPHAEPRSFPAMASRASLCSFPYSFIHHLRRAYAHRLRDAGWTAQPLEDGADPTRDPMLEAAQGTFESHLLCHSDAEGFYVPIDFVDVLFSGDEEPALPGGMLGSSYRLLEELVLVAPALGIELHAGVLSDDEAARVDGLACGDSGLHREYASWLSLHEAARLSIQYRTAIVFS
jgi:hypothetical protein